MGERKAANKRRLVNAQMEMKYKLKQSRVDFSALICILFINVLTDLANRSIVKVEKCVAGYVLETDS